MKINAKSKNINLSIHSENLWNFIKAKTYGVPDSWRCTGTLVGRTVGGGASMSMTCRFLTCWSWYLSATLSPSGLALTAGGFSSQLQWQNYQTFIFFLILWNTILGTTGSIASSVYKVYQLRSNAIFLQKRCSMKMNKNYLYILIRELYV